MIMKIILILISISILLAGCGWIADAPRTAWGSSIRVLSNKRSEAETGIFMCHRDEFFNAVMKMTYAFGAKKTDDAQQFILFAKDPDKKYMIIMGVPDSVDTTEVGLFFDEINDQQTRLEVSSLSTRAKRTAARIIFEQISDICALVE